MFPGDRVDMVLTQTVTGGGDGPPLKVSETIIRNLRVLATDQRITDKDEDGKTQVKTFSNVTLEVTPRIAEKIAVAQSLGALSLSLRSIADNTSDLERAVAAGDIKVPAGANPADEKQMLLAMANRPIDTNTTFSTGGDVSRFQRRTRPGPRRRRPDRRSRRRLGQAPVAAGSLGSGRPRSLAAIMSPLFRWELAKMKTSSHHPPGSPRHRTGRTGHCAGHRRRRGSRRSPSRPRPSRPRR